MASNSKRKTDETDKPGAYVPFRIDTSKPAVEAERIALFYIDDREYSGPARVSVGTAIKALEIAATQGVQAAAWHCLVSSIGQEAIDALTECEHVTFEQAQSLMTKISDMYFGQALEIAGK